MTTRRECRLIMPCAAHVEDHLAMHVAMQSRLITEFGGYTLTHGRGGWRDDATGETVEEKINIYDVAIDGPGELATLSAIGASFGGALEQKSIYLRTPEGEVVFIDPDITALARLDTTRPVQTMIPFDPTLTQTRAVSEPPVPEVGDIWAMRAGGHAMVLEITTLDGSRTSLVAVTLTPRPLTSCLRGTGRMHFDPSAAHPNDLVRLIQRTGWKP